MDPSVPLDFWTWWSTKGVQLFSDQLKLRSEPYEIAQACWEDAWEEARKAFTAAFGPKPETAEQPTSSVSVPDDEYQVVFE